jgi:hypothetical protein
MKLIFSLVVIFFSVVIGFLIGSTEHSGLFTGIKWTDVLSVIVTSLGFIFAFVTYFQWLKNKRKEDAYLVAKKYVASLDEVEEYLHELIVQYHYICPAPGVMVESKEMSIKRIEHLHTVWEYLYQARRNLYKSNRELVFWDVSLNEEFKHNYVTINKVLDKISVVSSVLNNQLYHFVERKDDSMNKVLREKEQFDKYYNLLHIELKKRVESR